MLHRCPPVCTPPAPIASRDTIKVPFSRSSEHCRAMALPHLRYTLEETRTRTIRKFNIQGTEYRLKVEPIAAELPQHLMVGAVYDVFDRE